MCYHSIVKAESAKIFFFGILLITSRAYSWGHSMLLNTKWYQASLVATLISTNEISYCVDLDLKGGSYSISTQYLNEQIEKIIKVWLTPVIDSEYIKYPKIYNVSCESNKFNLQIKIGDENKYNNMGSYQIEKFENGHYFSFVKIATNYSWNQYQIVNTINLFSDDSIFQKHLYDFGSKKYIELGEFAKINELDQYQLFWSSYRVLLHEIGHSFGLCDTLESMINYECDPYFLTKQYNQSVMSDSMYLTLTDDDREGIRQLFKRFILLK